MKTYRHLPLAVRTAAACGLVVLALLAQAPAAHAVGSPDPNQSGSVGLEGKISSPPPTQAATISTPRNGQSFTTSPITVAGLCKTDLLVKIFSNNVFVGSAICKSGSYNLQVGLFSGKNDLVARVYDSLDQAGPDSNVISVTFIDANFAQAGAELTLTSNFARRGANPGTELTWPIVLSGGTGPYAISVDWGDSSGTDLQSETFAGNISLKHTYKQAGIYAVIIKATDHNGATAYLQVVAVANGEVAGGTSGSSKGNSGGATVKFSPEWYFFLPIVPLLLASFWLGSRNELYVIRKRLDRARGSSTQ
jgi:hypothetical protein